MGEQRLAAFLARQRHPGHKQPAEPLAKLKRAPEGRVGEAELAARRAIVLAPVLLTRRRSIDRCRLDRIPRRGMEREIHS